MLNLTINNNFFTINEFIRGIRMYEIKKLLEKLDIIH